MLRVRMQANKWMLQTARLTLITTALKPANPLRLLTREHVYVYRQKRADTIANDARLVAQ